MLQGYEKSTFTAETRTGHSITHDVYARGDAKRIVVVLQELPGINPPTLEFADRLLAAGYRVVLPHLFGPLGKTATGRNLFRVTFCMRREFRVLAAKRSSPIVDWLRALCQELRRQHDARGVAVVGMCLTGNFAISLMADDAVLASVASQPSLPLPSRRGLHMTADDIDTVRDRLDETEPMHALRFAQDRFCRATKFTAIEEAFNHGRERIRCHTMPGKGHSVLTADFVDEAGHPTHKALQEVLAYFARSFATAESADPRRA